ncbi:MAG: hypothetical protein IKO49_08120, partial [Bacilli bacterium]|nr:hypothetical protein [Bacilli bacterium]
DKNMDDIYNKIQNSGALNPPEEQTEEIDYTLHPIKDKTKMKEIFLQVKKPNGALLIKAEKGTEPDDIIDQVKNSGIMSQKSEPQPQQEKPQKGKEAPSQGPTPAKSGKPPVDPNLYGKPQNLKDIQYMLVPKEDLRKYDRPDKFGQIFVTTTRPGGAAPAQVIIIYLYRKVSLPPAPGDGELKNIKNNTNLDDLYRELRNSGFISDKPGEGIQIFKVMGPADSNDYNKHIKESEALYRKQNDEDAQIRAQSVKLYPHGKEGGEKDVIVYIKISGGYKPDVYYKTNGEADLNAVLQQVQEKGAPQKDGKSFEIVTGSELEQIKEYFKPKDQDLEKPKASGEDYKTPKAYFYTTKNMDRVKGDIKNIIQSVTLLSDPNNNLNKGQLVEYLFKEDIEKLGKPSYCYTIYNPSNDLVQLQTIDGNAKVSEIRGRPGEGIQILKTVGTVGPDDKAAHLREARKKSQTPTEGGRPPSSFYYKSQVLGGGSKAGEGGSEPAGKVDSITIKRDDTNKMHTGKDVETVFKEGEEEDGVKFPGEPKYYYCKVKAGENAKPENVQLFPTTGKTKLDDIYKEIKKLGPVNKHDGIQLYKVCGSVENQNIVDHLKEALELFNNPDDDKKGDQPTTSYYTTEVMAAKAPAKTGGNEGGFIESVTYLSGDDLRKLNMYVVDLFRDQIGGTQPGQGGDIRNPVLYYVKILGGDENHPNVQLVKIDNNTRTSDMGPDGTIIIRCSGDANPRDIIELLKQQGILAMLYRMKPAQTETVVQVKNKVAEKSKPKEELKERKKAIQYAKVSPTQLSNLSDPDLEQKYTVDDIIGPLDEEEEAEQDPNAAFYYTKIITADKAKPNEDPVLKKIDGNLGMEKVAQMGQKGEGALLIKAPHYTKMRELMDQIKQDQLNIIKPDEEEGDEITTAIYYTTELYKSKPKEVEKNIAGSIPLKLYLFAKSKEAKDDEEDTQSESSTLSAGRNIAPEDNEIADNKQPKEMVRDIMKYNIGTIDQITVAPSSNEYLARKTNFGDTITKALQNDKNDEDFLLTALHSLGNYLFNENGPNYSKLDLPKTYELLRQLQTKYYANPEILTQLNYISGALVKNLKDDKDGKEYSQKFYNLIPETINCQDNNPDLVLFSMKLMNDSLKKKPYLIDHVFEETVPTILSLLKLYKDNPNIQENGYGILSQFAKNKVYSSQMINNAILPVAKEILHNTLNSDSLQERRKPIRTEVLKLLNNIAQDTSNAPREADELMDNLISDLRDHGLAEYANGKDILKLIDTLLNNSQCAAPFVQYGGIDTFMDLLDKYDSNIELITNIFQIFKKVANASDDYKRMLQQKKLPDKINRLIKKVGVYDKKAEYEGRQLLFTVNLAKVQLEDPNKINVSEIKINEPIPPEVRNFLTSGKQVKVISEDGEIKPMVLVFSNDLMKISCKKSKSDLPPKPKYIIDTPTIKKVVKGHATDAFAKSKGFFRSIPKPEVCFSIIGPTTVDGVKQFNIECESEKEVDKWIKYLQIVINYFKKTHIKGSVLIKK